VSYGFRTGRSEKSWNDSPATGRAILLLETIDSLSGFSIDGGKERNLGQRG